MKILLDECLPVDFRHSFPNHETHSAEWAGLKGKKNGELLIRSRTNQLEDLLPLAPAIINVLESIEPGQTVVIAVSG